MRYYDITMTTQDGKPVQPNYYRDLGTSSYATSFFMGRTLGGALDVEIDVPISNYATPKGNGLIRIWGVSIPELSQSTLLSYQGADRYTNIVVKAGMQKGLPLAKPSQAGIIVRGTILQAFGEWVGTSQHLDLILAPMVGTNSTPAPISFSWEKNTPLAQAIQTSLRAAFPLYQVSVSISDRLVLSYDQKGSLYKTLSEFSKMISNLTRGKQFAGIPTLSGGKYDGVSIAIRENRIVVYDGTADHGQATFANPILIQFEDMIGQPTWIGAAEINFKTVMRADIGVGDYIKLPDKLSAPYVLTTQGGAAYPNAPSRNESIFKGVFRVRYVHHMGRFRQPDGNSWVTIFEAVTETPGKTN